MNARKRSIKRTGTAGNGTGIVVFMIIFVWAPRKESDGKLLTLWDFLPSFGGLLD